FGGHLRWDRVAALADLYCSREYRYLTLCVHQYSGVGSCRRAGRLLNAGEALADLCTGLRRRRYVSPVDGLGSLDEGFLQSHSMKLFAPIRRVAFDENVFHADLDGIHAQTLGDFVHL